ncbi:hypothetical protein WEN_00205 [Mycoplasma wenyonii str. Massachusetts]|uniref:Lipoprotein n=1 Tax=Mycoplasma wenyonii (strain Massachusetts) TaxID=1197325 RepID=I6Z5L9_MYCWM|nr:hypothetical protein [Mycoplasma wenyonii]AFN64848.1 hypothetical protein WEN_00205 [Mycoplasma wenyonii str. Massachusetts]
MITGLKILATVGVVGGVGGSCGTLTWFFTKDSATNLVNSAGHTELTPTNSLTDTSTNSEALTRSESSGLVVVQRDTDTGNCRGVEISSDLVAILKERGKSKDDYVAVYCKDTNQGEEEIKTKMSGKWIGLFPNEFFVNGSMFTKTNQKFQLFTKTTEKGDRDYSTEFSGNRILDTITGTWGDAQIINGKSVTTVTASSEEVEELDTAYLLFEESSSAN